MRQFLLIVDNKGLMMGNTCILQQGCIKSKPPYPFSSCNLLIGNWNLSRTFTTPWKQTAWDPKIVLSQHFHQPSVQYQHVICLLQTNVRSNIRYVYLVVILFWCERFILVRFQQKITVPLHKQQQSNSCNLTPFTLGSQTGSQETKSQVQNLWIYRCCNQQDFSPNFLISHTNLSRPLHRCAAVTI